LLKEIDTKMAFQQEAPMSDDFPPIELPPESTPADQYPYGMDSFCSTRVDGGQQF